MKGYKTYTVSLSMLLLGLYWLTAQHGATWADPQGEIKGAVSHVLGWLAILLAASTASLRHAIAGLGR